MKAPLQAAILIALTATATTAVVLPVASAQQSATASAPAPALVALPDFTQLVAQVGPRTHGTRSDGRRDAEQRTEADRHNRQLDQQCRLQAKN